MAESPGLKSNNALGIKAGIAHSHIRRIKLQESMATVDILDKLAEAFGIHPFELLTDGEDMRASAWAKAMWGKRPEDPIPPPPQKPKAVRHKETAHRRRKKKGRKDGKDEGDTLQ